MTASTKLIVLLTLAPLAGCGQFIGVKPYEQMRAQNPVMGVSVARLMDQTRTRAQERIEAAHGATQHGGPCACN